MLTKILRDPPNMYAYGIITGDAVTDAKNTVSSIVSKVQMFSFDIRLDEGKPSNLSAPLLWLENIVQPIPNDFVRRITSR